MGPMCLALCRLVLVLSPMMLLGTLLDTPFPLPPRLLFVLPAIGAVLLAPKEAVLRIQVSLPFALLVMWLGMSALWTIDFAETFLTLHAELAPLFALVLVAGLLPVDETVRWWVRGTKLQLFVMIFATAQGLTEPPPVVDGRVLAGWDGWYFSKNEYGRATTLAFLTIFVLDRSPSKWLWLVLASVFIGGSSSATALAAALVAIGLVFWANRYRSVGDTWGGTYLFASIVSGLGGIVGVYFFVELIVQALGRDITFSNRTAIWTASLDFIEREPWLGYGYGAIWHPENAQTQEIWSDIGFAAANAHSGPLGVALDVGLPGLTIWFLLWLSTFGAALRLLQTSLVAVWAFAFLLIQLMVGFVEPVFLYDWLTPLILARILLAKLALDERRRRSDRDVLVDRVLETIDLDAPVARTGGGGPKGQPARS